MVEIRPARGEELAAVGQLTLRAYEEYRDRIPQPYWDQYAAELADAEARARQGTVLVAERDGELVGSATVIPQPDGTAQLRMLAVAPGARRGGVGRALMAATVAQARASGARELVWQTASFMESARTLYAALGHQPVSAVEVAPGVQLLTYRLVL